MPLPSRRPAARATGPVTASPRAALAWAWYDWANSAFAVTVISAFFPLLLKRYWDPAGGDATASTFLLGTANAAGSLLIAILSPLLGAMADRAGRKKAWLVLFAATGILATLALSTIGPGAWQLAILVYALATIGFSASNQFYDALLVDVAPEARYHYVSGLGFGLGYLGGGLLFAFDVAMTLNPSRFGLRDATHAALVSFATVALWWAVFSVPLCVAVREPRRGPPSNGSRRWVREAFGEVAATMRKIRHDRPLMLFLLAYWLYIDAVGTVARMAVDYGIALGLDETSLIKALLITQFVGFPAAVAFGSIGARIGARLAIGIGLAVYVVAILASYFMRSATEFYALAIVVGLVQGGVQSLSRSLFAQLVPGDRAAEYFGFYNMLGKFAAILGPFLMGLAAVASGSPRAGVLPIAALFIAGAWLLWRVDAGGRGPLGRPD